MSLIVQENRIDPTRGIVATASKSDVRYDRVDVERWIRLNRVVFKTEKIDVIAPYKHLDDLLHYAEYARGLDCKLSYRVDCSEAAPDLSILKVSGFLDIHIAPKANDHAWTEWVFAAKNAGLDARLTLPISAFESAANSITPNTTVRSVAFTAYDPVTNRVSDGPLDNAAEVIAKLQGANIEVSLVNVPFCAVPEDLWPNNANERQLASDHQFYNADSLDAFRDLFEKGPFVVKKALLFWLGRYTLMANPIDEKILPWLLEHPWLRARTIAWHRLTRHKRLSRSVPKPLEITSEDEARRAAEAFSKSKDDGRGLSSTCAHCQLKHHCNGDTHPGSKALKRFEPKQIGGDYGMYPLRFAVDQPKYYDEIDEARRYTPERWDELAQSANDIMANTSPDRDIDSFEYSVEGTWCHQLPGGVRWYGLSNTEKISTPLGTLDPPFTIAYMAGGGIAEYTGFALGRDCKLVCPMEAYQHQIALHVAADGTYVLLRDGKPVRPMRFEGNYYAPTRLGTQLQPRISIWNIDDSLVTQNVKIWNESLAKSSESSDIKFTFITVCVRYARRLQAMLQSIAHQQNFDLSKIELIIAYLPDADSTEDILESFSLAHPEITVHRSTIAENRARAKGFIINECLEKASGEWVVLLDADTMIPPNMLEEVSKHTDTANFIVPDGRKLLEPDVTAQILLGEVRPWECWNDLLGTEGEFRYREMGGTPIGFCQIVRRSCFDEVKYYEVDHFEGADWQFSIDMRERFGDEIRLSGMPVLHLDHGGSKWYGTKRHF